MLTSSYTSALAQYRDIEQAVLIGQMLVTTSDPPATFTDVAVINLLSLLMQEGALPAPHTDDQLLYCVVMPVGVSSGGDSVGEHSYFRYTDGHNAHYAWVTNSGQCGLAHLVEWAQVGKAGNRWEALSSLFPLWSLEVWVACISSPLVRMAQSATSGAAPLAGEAGSR
jgi:hypothetical protein